MFKIAQRRSVTQTVDYFLHEPELSQEEKTGVWIGRGALEIGLTPPPQKPQAILAPDGKPARPSLQPSGMIVTEKDFRRVLEGYAPDSSPSYGRPLNAYVRPNRRAAWDCVVSPHKSISVAALCTGKADPEVPRLVRTAFDLARGDLFAVMEARARHNNGHNPDVVTGTLLAAAFTHFTSRRNDPQLHTHLLLINATRDYHPSSRRDWYALEPLPYYRQARVLDLVFQRELHRRLREQGLDSQMMKVDGLPVAVLPAVNGRVCHRNSQAHQAILAMTKDRWNREDRTVEQKRRENLLNDRYRPSKVGQLAARTERFERAVSRAEALAIVRQVRLEKPPGKPSPPKLPTSQSVEERMREAFRLLKRGFISPGKELLLAYYAAQASPLIGIQPFITAAARFKQQLDDMNLGGLQGSAMHNTLAGQAEEAVYLRQDTARRRAKRGAGLDLTPQPVVPQPSEDDELVRPQAAFPLSASTETSPRRIPLRASDIGRVPGGLASPRGTVPRSAPSQGFAPSEPLPTAEALPSFPLPAYLRDEEPEAPDREVREQGQGPPRGP